MIDFKNGAILKLRTVDNDSFRKEITPLLTADENIVASFRTVRDGVVFTDKRIISINIQGVTGMRKDYTTMPYKKIQVFSVESAGLFDIESELELWFSTLGSVKFEFTSNADVALICRVISEQLL